MVTFTDIEQALPSLSPSELEQLRERIGFVLSMKGRVSANTDVNTNDADVQFVLDVMYDVLTGLGVDLMKPYIIRKHQSFPAFRRKVPDVVQFLRRHSGNRVERASLLAIGIRLLYRDLSEMGISVSTITMLGHVHRIPAVINAAFPGYAEAGLLRMIPKQRIQKPISLKKKR